MMKNECCPICSSENLINRPETLRDSDDIGVLECKECTHVFLDSFDHINDAYFDRGEFLLSKGFLQSIDERMSHYDHENSERLDRVGPLIVNKRILDFGCGAGALMKKMAPLAKHVEGLEPTDPFREYLTKEGHTVHADVSELKGPYDVVTMFHVLEHLPDPKATVELMASLLAPNGLIYLEVPNVNDALTSLYDIEESRKFLFFRDHLHYFSRTSLSKMLSGAGFTSNTISGHNRFNLANHLYWLKHGKPGGHTIWNFLETPSVVREYSRALAAMDMSDSLIAQFRVD